MKHAKAFISGVIVASLLAALIVGMLARSAAAPGDEFAGAVDLSPLDRSAVYSNGRLKSFDSFADETLSTIAGRQGLNDLPDDFAYLDLMLVPQRWSDQPTVFVKNKVVRKQIEAAALRDGIASADEIDAFLDAGLVRADVMQGPEVGALMDRISRDLIRGTKVINQVRGSVITQQPDRLAGNLRIVPLPPGAPDAPWISVDELIGRAQTPGAALAEQHDANLLNTMRAAWLSFEQAWKNRDAKAANAALESFASAAGQAGGASYPSTARMAFESWYFKLAHFTWVWLIYLLAAALLLMGIAYKWDGARSMGLGMFAVAFALHTVALGWRWWVSGRWPNSNMFEAVTTSVWLATIAAIVFELVSRKSPLRTLFVLGAAGASMCAMMAAHYIPELDPGIRNMMPILHDLWLYIHTNVIIASYALIGMAAMLGVVYLIRRCVTGSTGDYARSGGAMLFAGAQGPGLTQPGSRSASTNATPNLGQILDGASMVLIELSFLLLWAGIVMGAIWADHSWGRPWGWDPKEVFALNTFIVYVILIHVRLKARDKGLWTAALSLVGFGVMIFNWVVINFVISGLHSYA